MNRVTSFRTFFPTTGVVALALLAIAAFASYSTAFGETPDAAKETDSSPIVNRIGGENRTLPGLPEPGEYREPRPQSETDQAESGLEIRPREPGIRPGPPDGLRVDIWTDRNAYWPGEPVRIYFRTSQDAYVYVFDRDTRGTTRQIFPNYYDPDNYCRGAATYSIPDRSYSLTVTGPPGREFLEIVAVPERYEILQEYGRMDLREPFPLRRQGGEGLIRSVEESHREKKKAGGPSKDRFEKNPETGRVESRIIVGPPEPDYYPGVTARSETTLRVLGGPRDEPLPVPRGRGKLVVTTDPPHAEIRVDGYEAGRSPDVLVLRYGWHRIEVERRGYQRQSRRVLITSPHQERLHFDLQRERHYFR